LMTALQISLSDYTGAWLLYVGLMFILVVMYAPSGLAGILLKHRPLLAAGTFRQVLPAYALAVVPVLMLAAGVVLLIETCHHLLVKASEGTAMRALWIDYDANSSIAWAAILLLLAIGIFTLRRVAPRISEAFHAALHEAIRRRTAA